jgi:hypothetical protein
MVPGALPLAIVFRRVAADGKSTGIPVKKKRSAVSQSPGLVLLLVLVAVPHFPSIYNGYCGAGGV